MNYYRLYITDGEGYCDKVGYFKSYKEAKEIAKKQSFKVASYIKKTKVCLKKPNKLYDLKHRKPHWELDKYKVSL